MMVASLSGASIGHLAGGAEKGLRERGLPCLNARRLCSGSPGASCPLPALWPQGQDPVLSQSAQVRLLFGPLPHLESASPSLLHPVLLIPSQPGSRSAGQFAALRTSSPSLSRVISTLSTRERLPVQPLPPSPLQSPLLGAGRGCLLAEAFCPLVAT